MLDLRQVVLLITITLVSSELEPRIVGGNFTNIKSYPHAVLFIVKCKQSFLCGGSVLTHHIVLTAGHCLYPCKRVPNFSILLKYGHETSEYMDTNMVSKFVIHGRYNDQSLVNDIGMAYAEKTIPLNKNVQRVAILNKRDSIARYGYVAGWGITSDGKAAPSLKHVRQSFSSAYQCNKFGFFSPGVICTGDVNEKEYPDQGDSGSALVVNDYVQIGIVSFKHPEYGIIGYTDTTYYYNWIIKTSKTLHCN